MARIFRSLRTLLSLGGILAASALFPAFAAAAGLYASPSSGSILSGETVTVNIMVNTSGQSANAFEAYFTYPSDKFEPVRGSYTGSICTIFISNPDPAGGSASFACGNTAGFTGTGLVASIVLKATSPGSANFGLSGCSVLANDGAGTEIGSSCSGAGLSITQVSTPAPTPVPTVAATQSTPTPTARATPKPGATPTPPPSQTAKPAEIPAATVAPEVTVTPPPVEVLPEETATPVPVPTEAAEAEVQGRRTIGDAFKDLFKNVREFRLNTPTNDFAGLIALLFTILPILGLLFAIVFFSYRLYLLERYRRRSLDRLFEMELAELASLEGKMDLLAEKGSKGREQYREEFSKAKERILQQVKPDFNKKVSTPPELVTPAAETTAIPENPEAK